MKRKREKETIELIFESDLKKFLERFNLLDEFLNKKVKCVYCGKSVSFSNLGLILIREGKPMFICDNPECLKKIRVQKDVQID